jgi:lipid A oxidase
MRGPESTLRHFPIWLTTGLLLAVTMAAIGSQMRLRLPFDIFPGAAYLALLTFPAIWREATGGDEGADLQLGAYGGPAQTARSGLHLTQPDGTDLQFRNIVWEGQPFRPPPYYGLRAIYWLPGTRLGLMGDFTHIKAIAVKEKPVDQSGLRDAVPVPPHETFSTTFARLEFTHGYNLLTVNLIRRGALRNGTLVPYAGAGIGLAYPHVEVQRQGAPKSARTYEYQVTGPAWQVLGGLEWRFGRRLSQFIEYKLSCAAIHGDLLGGGGIDTTLCTHQFLAGPAVHLRVREAIPGSP